MGPAEDPGDPVPEAARRACAPMPRAPCANRAQATPRATCAAAPALKLRFQRGDGREDVFGGGTRTRRRPTRACWSTNQGRPPSATRVPDSRHALTGRELERLKVWPDGRAAAPRRSRGCAHRARHGCARRRMTGYVALAARGVGLRAVRTQRNGRPGRRTSSGARADD